MIKIDKTTSIKSALLWIIMLVCSLTLCTAMLVSTLQDIRQQRQKLIIQLQSYLSIMTFNARSSLLRNDASIENDRLRSFAKVEMLHNIHIYQWHKAQNELTLFASYNNNGAYPAQFQRVKQLQYPELSEKYIELSSPVMSDDQLLGYVYLRAGLDELDTYIRNRIAFDILLALTALCAAFFISAHLQRRLTSPINILLNTLQQASKNKKYRTKAPDIPIQEFNTLGRAINIMLSKIDLQFNQQRKAEQEIRQLNQDLEHKIEVRTQALKDTNQELLQTLATLHQYQNQIVETEKMASLGQMVAGIAHEVNTPIGLGITASTLLQDKLTDITQAFNDKKLTASQLEKYLTDSSENLSIIYRNLDRAASLISSFKQVAVDQSNENRRIFNISQLIEEVLISLRPNLKKTTHQIYIDCPAELEIDSKPGPLTQILINLIMNSLIHAFDDQPNGRIDISVMIQNNRCQLHYSDNGSGVADIIKKRIFDPFVTTKRGEGGSGLGMHLVYNLVTQALHGKIQLESFPDQGIKIDIDFPVVVTNGY